MTTDADNRIIRLLACVPRGKPDAQGAAPEEFRVSLAEFKGHRYISLRLFFLAHDGQLYPSPGKGCSVRLGEAEEVAAALIEGLRVANETKDEPAPTRPNPRHQRREPASASSAPRSSPPREVQLDAYDDLAEFRR